MDELPNDDDDDVHIVISLKCVTLVFSRKEKLIRNITNIYVILKLPE